MSEDQREGGLLGGQYFSGQDRKAAGINSDDGVVSAQIKLARHNASSSGNYSSSSSSCSDSSPSIPGPVIFGDPDVQKALIKGACWLTFFILAFCFVFFQAPGYFESAVKYVMPHNSDNWEYRVAGEGAANNRGFGLAQLVSGKDPRANKIKPEALIETYQTIYGNTLTNNQYHDIVKIACDQGYCKDVSIATLRTFAVQNNTANAFDRQTAAALTAHWSKVDSKAKYDYQPYYSGCMGKGQECVNNAITENYKVSYRNTLEKEVE